MCAQMRDLSTSPSSILKETGSTKAFLDQTAIPFVSPWHFKKSEKSLFIPELIFKGETAPPTQKSSFNSKALRQAKRTHSN